MSSAACIGAGSAIMSVCDLPVCSCPPVLLLPSARGERPVLGRHRGPPFHPFPSSWPLTSSFSLSLCLSVPFPFHLCDAASVLVKKLRS